MHLHATDITAMRKTVYIDYEEKITKKELLDALDALDECIEYISRNTENMKSILRGL